MYMYVWTGDLSSHHDYVGANSVLSQYNWNNYKMRTYTYTCTFILKLNSLMVYVGCKSYSAGSIVGAHLSLLQSIIKANTLD